MPPHLTAAAGFTGHLNPTRRGGHNLRRCAVKRPVHALSPSPRRHRRNALLRGRKPSSSSSPSPPRPTSTPKRSRVEVEASCRSGLCRSPWDAVPAPGGEVARRLLVFFPGRITEAMAEDGEENLLATVQHIVQTLGSSDTIRGEKDKKEKRIRKEKRKRKKIEG